MKKEEIREKLKETENYLNNISGVVGVFYTGSTASEKWDEYSDVDIDVVIKDSEYEKFCKKIPKILGVWGEIKLINHYPNHPETYAYVGQDYFKVEIYPIKNSELNPSHHFNRIRIGFDKTGKLKNFKNICKKDFNSQKSIVRLLKSKVIFDKNNMIKKYKNKISEISNEMKDALIYDKLNYLNHLVVRNNSEVSIELNRKNKLYYLKIFSECVDIILDVVFAINNKIMYERKWAYRDLEKLRKKPDNLGKRLEKISILGNDKLEIQKKIKMIKKIFNELNKMTGGVVK